MRSSSFESKWGPCRARPAGPGRLGRVPNKNERNENEIKRNRNITQIQIQTFTPTENENSVTQKKTLLNNV